MNEEKKCPCDAMIDMKKKVESHGTRLSEGDINFALIQQTLSTIEKDTTEIKSDIKTIKEKPAKRWETAVSTVVNTILLAVIALILARIGL